MSRPKIALQMYTVRDEAALDFAGTYRAVAQLGYPGVQPAGYGNLPAEEFKALLDQIGVEVAGTHIDLAKLESDLDGEIAYCQTIGTIDLVVPYIHESRRKTAGDWRQIARVLNEIGAECHRQGMRLSYHNHAFEFERFGDLYAIDILLGETEPEQVYFEPDVYWIRHAGEDPAAYIRRYADRCPLIHLKDMTSGEPHTFAEVGEGVIDFTPIFDAAEAGSTEWYIVEQDRSLGSSLDSARTSLENLKRWGKL